VEAIYIIPIFVERGSTCQIFQNSPNCEDTHTV